MATGTDDRRATQPGTETFWLRQGAALTRHRYTAVMSKIPMLVFIVPLAAMGAEGPIQDNSFLVEEAYNQEDGIVQHIHAYQRFRQSRDWIYTFTQEWPVGGRKHQFSYTVPAAHVGEFASGSGVGDVALNYRYQLVGDGEARLAISPRFSLIAPTGNEARGRGLGATSYQMQVPLSIVLAPAIAAHANAGYTWTPRARDADGNRANLGAWSAGQSFVWLATRRVNVMLEAIYTRSEEVAGVGRTSTVKSAFVSPGVRWSYEFASGLQIVPGIALPIGVGPSRHEKSVFIYFSFEHPFRK